MACDTTGGCTSTHATSFLLTPGNEARFSAEGSNVQGTIENRGPAAVTATITGREGRTESHAIAPSATLIQALRGETVVLRAEGGSAEVGLELRGAGGLELRLKPR